MALLNEAAAVHLGATAADAVFAGVAEVWAPPDDGPVEGVPPTFVAANAARISSNAGTTLNVSTPTGVQDDDLLVAFVAPMASGTTTTVTPPAGWTERFWVNPTGAQQPGLGCWTRTASTEAATQTFTLSAQIQTSVTLAAYRGAAFDVAGPLTGGWSPNGQVTIKGVTATSNNSLWVATAAGSDWNTTITVTGWTSRAATSSAIRVRTADKAISLGATADDVGSFVGKTSGDNFVSGSVVLGPVAA